MSDNTGEYFVNLEPSQQAKFESIVSYVRTIAATDPLVVDYFLNALVATGPEEVADQIEAWAGKVCELDSRERTAFCHGNSPNAERIIRVPSMTEIVDADQARC